MGRLQRCVLLTGEDTATCSWTIAPPAYATAETNDSSTDNARALMSDSSA